MQIPQFFDQLRRGSRTSASGCRFLPWKLRSTTTRSLWSCERRKRKRNALLVSLLGGAKISLLPAFRYVPLRSARALGGGAHKEIRARARKTKKDSSRSSRTIQLACH